MTDLYTSRGPVRHTLMIRRAKSMVVCVPHPAAFSHGDAIDRRQRQIKAWGYYIMAASSFAIDSNTY